MIFDNNMAYQTYRVLISIFGTLGMIISITPMKKSCKRNLLILGSYIVYAVVFPYVSSDSCLFCGAPSLQFPFRVSSAFT